MPQPTARNARSEPPSFARESVSEAVTGYLRDLIMSGQLRAGDHLRIEHLASEFQVSVTPVRESLLALLGEGFLEREAYRGYAVAEISRRDIADLFFVQSLLAGELAARAAATISEQILDELDAIQRELETAARRKRFEEVEDLNHRLHRVINKVPESPKIAWFLLRASRYAPRTTWQDIRGWPSASVSDHPAILRALRDHDADAARDAMARHIANTGELLLGHLEDRGFWDQRQAQRT